MYKARLSPHVIDVLQLHRPVMPSDWYVPMLTNCITAPKRTMQHQVIDMLSARFIGHSTTQKVSVVGTRGEPTAGAAHGEAS